MALLIRYSRIIKHFVLFIATKNIVHKYEYEHYFYMKQFKTK